MNHYASRSFWACYEDLPPHIRALADKNFELLKRDVKHPSLQFKSVGPYWSARVGLAYRALATPVDDDMLWFWIGTHAEYDRMLRN